MPAVLPILLWRHYCHRSGGIIIIVVVLLMLRLGTPNKRPNGLSRFSSFLILSD